MYADVVDPARSFCLYLDRWSAECLADALRLYVAAGGNGWLLEDLEAWLANQAEPYADDEEPFQPLRRRTPSRGE